MDNHHILKVKKNDGPYIKQKTNKSLNADLLFSEAVFRFLNFLENNGIYSERK